MSCRKQYGFIMIAVLLLIAFAVPVCMSPRSRSGYAPVAAAPDERVEACRAFLLSAGWRTADSPPEISETTIPALFNGVYARYNRLQRAQGFDLSAYKGTTVTKLVFEITGYPDAEGVFATVFWSRGRIIGGDISSVRLDGFMHGFHMEEYDDGTDPT